MDLEYILEMWEKDSQIDDVLLDDASKKIPNIHAKYLTLYSEFNLLSKKKVLELKKATHFKWLYYSGKAKPEDYEDKPFPHKVMKADVWNWVNVDDDIQKIQAQIDYYDTILNTLSDILKQIHQMSIA